MSVVHLDLTEAERMVREPPAKTLDLVRADSVTIKKIGWIWPEWLARGKMHVLAGQPGVAKTMIALRMAATVSVGGRWPDGANAPLGNVIIWSGEDDPEDTLTPRLIAAGADLKRVYFVGPVHDGENGKRPFDPSQDIDALRAAIALAGGAVLIIVDPIVSAVAGDSHKNAETRRSLQPLCDLAASTGSALVGISHFTKGTVGREPIERITGSLAFGAIARVVMVAAKEQATEGDISGRRIFARAKSNIGPDHGGFTYSVDQVTLPDHEDVCASIVTWGEPLVGTAREILATAETLPEETNGPGDEAERFLNIELGGGQVSAKDLQRAASSAGLSWVTVQRTATRLGVQKEKIGFGKEGAWVWRLAATPKMTTDPYDDQQNLTVILGDDGHLSDDQALNPLDEGVITL